MALDSIYDLKQRMALLERAHASAGMGHFVLDPKRKTIEFSSWVRDNIGLNDMPIPLDRLPEIVVEEEREEFIRIVAEVIERKEDFSFETVVMTANGKVRTQRISGITAFENEHTREGVIGLFGILQEITHEKRSKEEMLTARDAAQAELDARANLLAVVSHEIRTPLGGILGIIDQLKRERSAQERERALTLIEDSSEVLLDTLDAILQQARIGENTENLETKRFRPLSVAHRVAELFRPLARRKGLRIDVRGPSDVHAIGDPARLQQVISNFVSNGVKFTQSGSVSIDVTAPINGKTTWVFAIKDTGSGMDESRVAGIFTPFGTSSSDSLGRAVGAGLGLSIIRELVKSMGGTIDVESELGRGSTFTLSVPFEHAPLEGNAKDASTHHGTAAILVERASDRVQAEATASAYGFKLAEFDEALPKENPAGTRSILIADGGALDNIREDVLSQFDRVIALVSDGGSTSTDPALTKISGAEVVCLPNTQIARSLGKVLAKDNDDAA
ncbi:MAG: ATP-binding protein [Erythrobacter sp.]